MDFDFLAAKAYRAALRYAKIKDVTLPASYRNKQIALQKSQATFIAGLASLEQTKFMLGLLNKTLREGGTFQQFQQGVKDNTIGIDLPRYRLDNIFRTNLQTAYNHGRWNGQSVAAHSRPYLMYDAINDSRTRPSHMVMDQTILPRDDPWWNTHYPPCGYRCRCNVVSLTAKQALKRGVTPTPPDVSPDGGFDLNPGKDYQKGLTGALDNFGLDLIEQNPKLVGPIKEAKLAIREAAYHALSDTSHGLEDDGQ